jgi:phosphoglycerate kinase
MIKYIDELDLKGKRVFIRVDFNVPLDDERAITDDARIRAALPTINHTIEAGGKVVLGSHLGRPKGEPDPKFSLQPVADRLAELLDKKIAMAPDCIGAKVEKMVANLAAGDVLLLENLRFHGGEKKNEPEFAAGLAKLCDVYINDAFGTSHRAHASMAGVPAVIKEKAAGFLIREEMRFLQGILTHPERPFIVILGGAKVSDKIGVIENLIEKVDGLLVGGGMAYTFLKAAGCEIGNSKLEGDRLVEASETLEWAKSNGKSFGLPVDHIVATEFDENAKPSVTGDADIPRDSMGLDIGPKTIKYFKKEIEKAKTIFWNGPMGVFEWSNFAKGTFELAKAVASCNATSVVGGGDSAAAVRKAGVDKKITHISTGGGASLALMEGKTLPGLAALEE